MESDNNDTVFIPKNTLSAAIPVFYRARRFSVDILSPKNCFLSKRCSESTIETDKALRVQSLPGYGRRAIQQTLKATFKQPCRFLHHNYPQYHQRDKEESFILLKLDNGKQVVISCSDAQSSRRALTATTIPNVRGCRLISASVRATMSSKTHSCDGSPVSGSHQSMGHIPDSRRESVSDLLAAEECYYQQLRSGLDLYEPELRKQLVPSEVNYDCLFVAVELLIYQSALLVQNLKSVLCAGNKRPSWIGNCFSSTFWDVYQEYITRYMRRSRLPLERQQTDATLKEIIHSKELQGTPSLEMLLALPESFRTRKNLDMASIPLIKPETEIQSVSADARVIFDVNSPSDDDFGNDTEVEMEEMSEFDDGKSTDTENRSASGESVNNTLLSPDVHSYISESEASPIMLRKKRPAPMPPQLSPTTAARHSYAFDLKALQKRTSTDTESTTSESRLFYQTSTDSESLSLPESARGSNFPGELAGVDNLYELTPRRPPSDDSSLSPRPLSRLGRLREVFRSPQIGRRKTMREEKGSREKTPRVRKIKTGDGIIPVVKKSKGEEGSKSPKTKPARTFDPIPQMSNWIMAAGYDALDIDQEFEVKRVLDYEKFLSELLQETDNYHVDYVDISRSLIRVRSMMKDREEEPGNEDDVVMEAESSQDDLSTNNSTHGSRGSINTHDSNTTTTTTNNNNNNNNNNSNEDHDKLSARKSSTRRRSAPSALLFKSLASMKTRSPTSVWYNAGLGKKDQDMISQFKLADGDTDRVYIAEGSVQFAAGMQTQDRYLFLFSDLLLVTKQKSNTTFKLKQKVHLCDMWIASCVEEVSEITRPLDRSFVIGWPTTNVVTTFPSVETKDDWLSKFSQNITKQKIKEEHKSLQLKVVPKDIEAVTCSCCQMPIDVFTQAKDVVLGCLKQANIPDSEAKDYQLWVLSGKDNSPYPLIGHETPFSIKYNQARELSRSRSANDLDNMTAVDLDAAVENITGPGSKCEFYLKQKQSPRNSQFEDSPHHKPMKKHKKTPKIFNTIFRKKRVFGLPLSKICDKNLDPPEAIIKLMILVYQHGPQIPGILRRGNNIVVSKEIKEKINAGDKYNLEDHQAPIAASVFKEFLRSIPEGLMVCSLHDQWLSVNKDDPPEQKINKIKLILAKLPEENYHMLKLTICLLQHLAKHSSINHMGPSNLATCIAPSLYVHGANGSPPGKWKGGEAQKQMQDSVSEIQNVIAPLIAFLITYHTELFGEDILSMFVKHGCQASPAVSLDDRYDSQMQPSADEEEEEEDMIGDEDDDDNFSAELTDKHHRVQVHHGKPVLMRDSYSGTDSDSMHSVLSMQDGGMGLQHDDSSIDSLGDRDYYSHESPKVTKSHLSPSNLSRDSGLTLSDNQLYDEEAYQADFVNTSAQMFQAKLSNCDQPDLDSYDHETCRHNMLSQADKNVSPVPPPRKRSIRRKACNANSDAERRGFIEYLPQQPPFKHSASTTYLDESSNNAAHREQRHMQQLVSSAEKRVSDSSGNKQEATDQLSPMNIQKIRSGNTIGTLTKSESGSHLYLHEETPPLKFSLEPLEDAAEPAQLRRSSVNGNSVSASPQSRHSHSSGDSVISDSIYSTSRDGSINSAPPTPEERPDMFLNWIPDINLPGKPWDKLLHGANTVQSQTQSKSSDLLSKNDTTSENSCVDTSQTLNSPNMRKSEAQEAKISNKPHFSLMCETLSDYSPNSSQPPSKPSSLSNIHYKNQRFSSYLDLGSPPPDVVLQTLRNPASKNLVPVTATGAQHRRSSVDLSEPRQFHFSKEMQSIRPEEYLYVRSTPVIISPEDDPSIAIAASSKARLSKYIKDTNVQSLSMQPADRPLNYRQLQRNVMMKYNEPDDITEKQRKISDRAKAMYDKSLQLYQKDHHHHEHHAPNTQTSSNLGLSTNPAYGTEAENTQAGRLVSHEHMDITLTDFTSQDSFCSPLSDHLDDSGASGFLDISSISLSLEKDIVGGHKSRAESDASSLNRSVSPGNLLSISRNESRLSDTDSSGSSTVTVSTLSQRSDSFNRYSDLSSVTISSVTSSDSNPEVCSPMSNHRTASHNPSACAPRNSSSSEIDIEMMENEEEIDTYSDDLKKDPRELYLQSMQIYEQKASHGVSSTSQGISSSLSQGVSSLATHSIPASTSPVIKKSLISHSFPNPPKLQSSPVVPVSSSPKASTSAGRPSEPQTRESLNIPNVNLHRCVSDLAKHAHKQGSYSSHPITVGQDYSADITENKQSSLNTSIQTSRDVQLKSQPRDRISEYQQNFLRAKSCFHQAEGTKKTLSDTSSHHSVQSIQQSPTNKEGKPGKQPIQAQSATAEPTPANLPAANPSALPLGSNISHSQTTDPTSQGNKKEFPWSVKDLKSKYDTSSSYSYNSNESTSQTSHSRPQSPHKRHQDSPWHSRSNSSSSNEQVSSSYNTSPKTSVSHRHGPQSYTCEASHSSYSSSDDSYSSSPEKRSTWLSSSSLDSEEVSDYTNTTYI